MPMINEYSNRTSILRLEDRANTLEDGVSALEQRADKQDHALDSVQQRMVQMEKELKAQERRLEAHINATTGGTHDNTQLFDFETTWAIFDESTAMFPVWYGLDEAKEDSVSSEWVAMVEWEKVVKERDELQAKNNELVAELEQAKQDLAHEMLHVAIQRGFAETSLRIVTELSDRNEALAKELADVKNKLAATLDWNSRRYRK